MEVPPSLVPAELVPDTRSLSAEEELKTFQVAPGYRVGWVAAGAWARRVQQLKVMSSLSAAVPSQAALSDYLAQGGHDHHLRRLRQTLLTRRDAMLQAIADSFPEDTHVTHPQGGYFVWVALPPAIDALSLLRQALDHGVSLMPGQLFSADRRFTHCVRLNYGAAEVPALEAATRQLGELARAMAG